MKSLISNLFVHNKIFHSSLFNKEEPSYHDDYLISYHRSVNELNSDNDRTYINNVVNNGFIDYMELDVRETKDKKIVVSHDNDLIINGKHIRISDTNYREIKSIIISLIRVLFDSNGKKVIITPKFDIDYIPFCNRLIRVLKGNKSVIIQSSNHEALKYIKNNSDIECQLLIDSKDNFEYLYDFDRVSINKSLFNEYVYQEVLSFKKKLSLVGINTEEDFNEVFSIVGNNYKQIIYSTNNPYLILNLFESKEKKASEK